MSILRLRKEADKLYILLRDQPTQVDRPRRGLSVVDRIAELEERIVALQKQEAAASADIADARQRGAAQVRQARVAAKDRVDARERRNQSRALPKHPA